MSSIFKVENKVNYATKMEMEEMGDINGGHVVGDCSLNKNEVEIVGGVRNMRDRARDTKRDKIRELERDKLRDVKRDEEREVERDMNRNREEGGSAGKLWG